MAYGQKNYNELQGINGKYRINQIGCFLTAFCNLLERFGEGKSPLELNAIFRDRGIWIDVDDGVRDDLAWNSITRYNPEIVVGSIGNGNPPTNNVIVKQQLRPGVLHFSLVDHVDGSGVYIVDSVDGVVKNSNTYGAILQWASYNYDHAPSNPQPIAPPQAPAPAPEPTPAPADPDVVDITVQSGWGITHVLKAAGYPKESYESEAEWDRVAKLNGSETRLRLKPNQVVKVYRNPLPASPPAAPLPNLAPMPIPTPTQAPEVATEASQESEAEIIPVKVIPNAYQNSYVKKKATYEATLNLVVKDLAGEKEDLQLVKGQLVHGAGEFQKDGVNFIRTQKSVETNAWYGVPLSALEPYDDPSLFDLHLGLEAKEMLGHLSGREKVVALVAKLQGLLLRILNATKLKRSKK